MLPYSPGLLRCHPAWSQLENGNIKQNTSMTSCIYTKWKCCICNTIFEKKINNMKTSTGRCRPCALLLARKTLFYTGEIPLEEHRIIRAGVLQEIPVETIIGILRQQDKQGQYTEAVYQTWIQTIKGYQRHELLNNRFWDRKDVPWLSKRKRENAKGEDQASCLCPPVPKSVRLEEPLPNQKSTTCCGMTLSLFWIRSSDFLLHWIWWVPFTRLLSTDISNEEDFLQYFEVEIRHRLFLPFLSNENRASMLKRETNFYKQVRMSLVAYSLFGLRQCLLAHFDIKEEEEKKHTALNLMKIVHDESGGDHFKYDEHHLLWFLKYAVERGQFVY